MKAKKVLALVLCAALLVAGSVAATLAYLTSTTGVVTNTFTTGNVAITLDEAKVNEYGVADTAAARVKANEYKLIPGHTYVKDPKVHVTEKSEQCYVFVKVVDGLTAIQDATTIENQMIANGWKKLDGVENVWYYENIVDARTVAVDVPVFESFKVKGDANVAAYAGMTITVQAYAVQADNFGTAAAAYAAAPCTWGE